MLENPAIDDVVVLSVVLEEVKNKNMSVYNRIRAICSNSTRKFFVFSNEYHRYVIFLMIYYFLVLMKLYITVTYISRNRDFFLKVLYCIVMLIAHQIAYSHSNFSFLFYKIVIG